MKDTTFRDGVQAIVDELRQMRASVDAVLAALLPDEQSDEPAPCPHPEEFVVQFGITNGQDDWLCQACGYRSVHEGAPA